MHDSSKKAINNGNKHIINIYWMAKKNIPISKLPSLIYILKLIEIVHSIPFSSVDCERVLANRILSNVMQWKMTHCTY